MIALAVALAAVAAWLVRGQPPEARLKRVVAGRAAGGRTGTARARADGGRLAPIATACAAVAAVVVVGGLWGAVAAIAVVVGVPRLTRRLESRAGRRARENLERQAPQLADLLATTLASGATLESALTAGCGALGAPVADVVRPVLAALALGADPAQAWRDLADQPALRPIGAALARSVRSGAPLSGLLAQVAEDMRGDRQRRVAAAARAAGVRAVAPLGACFLPAFIVVGVVPVVVSLATGLLG